MNTAKVSISNIFSFVKPRSMTVVKSSIYKDKGGPTGMCAPGTPKNSNQTTLHI